MKYLKLFETHKEVEITSVCDIFTELLDRGCEIWVWQFPTYDGKKSGSNEFYDKLTYDSTRDDKINKFIPKKEYWFEIEAPYLTNDIGMYKIGQFIKNYNYQSIIDRLNSIGFSVYNKESGKTRWMGANTTPRITLIGQVY